MPKRIVDVSPELERRAWSRIREGRYSDFDHLVAVSVENQLAADDGDVVPWISGKGALTTPTRSSRSAQRPGQKTRRTKLIGSRPDAPLERVAPLASVSANTALRAAPWKPATSVKTVPEPEEGGLVAGPLWGQFYRILPAKPAVRTLADLSVDGPIPLAVFKDRATASAEVLGLLLESNDHATGRKFGERFSTSFPRSDEKSRKRYREQYLAYVRPGDGRLDGLLPRMKFINVGRENGTHTVGITSAGLEFASLPNPTVDDCAVDQGSSPVFSSAEVEFLLAHIRSRLPVEHHHMRYLMEAVDKGVTGRTALNERMRAYYARNNASSAPWTDAHVNTMRAGLVSRLFELGLVERARDGVAVDYQLTSSGRAFVAAQAEEAR